MKTVKLEEIVRQKDTELKLVVEHLGRGQVQEAIQNLDRQGRVHQICGYDQRISAIAKKYAKRRRTRSLCPPTIAPAWRSIIAFTRNYKARVSSEAKSTQSEH
jgi:AAA domain